MADFTAVLRQPFTPMRTAKWRRDPGALPRFGLLLFLVAISCRHRQEAAACPGSGHLVIGHGRCRCLVRFTHGCANRIVGPAYAALPPKLMMLPTAVAPRRAYRRRALVDPPGGIHADLMLIGAVSRFA
jgi:hypothetical protein